MKLKSLMLTAATAMALTTVGGFAWAEPSGVLRVAVGSDPATIDPHLSDLPSGNTVIMHVFDGLFRLNSNNEIEPNLAASHAFSNDDLTLTVTLHEGRTFSNGDALDAEAVVSSFKRLLNPETGSPYRGLYSAIDDIVAIDPLTVEFRLKEKSGHLLLLLAPTAASIVNTKAIEAMGVEHTRKPVGSGPYMVESFVGGERYRLVPNPAYNGTRPATLEAIDFTVVTEDGSRMALIETGDVDIAERVPPEAMATIDALDTASLITPPSMFSISMEMVLRGPLEDKRVREALNLAIDREGMVQGILGGLGTPSVGMPGPGTQDDLRVTFEPIKFDPEAAKALIAEAGYAPGEIALTMTCPTGRYIKDVQVCQAIQAQLQAIGVNATANIVDRGTWTTAVTTPADQRTDNMALAGRATFGMDFTLYRIFHSTSGANVTGFNYPRVDELLEKGRVTTDLAEQKAIYGEAQQIIWDERPSIFLWYQNQALGVSDKVEGFLVQPNETMVFDQVTIAQ